SKPEPVVVDLPVYSWLRGLAATISKEPTRSKSKRRLYRDRGIRLFGVRSCVLAKDCTLTIWLSMSSRSRLSSFLRSSALWASEVLWFVNPACTLALVLLSAERNLVVSHNSFTRTATQ